MQNLQILRKRKNLKQEEVADFLLVSKQAYSNYERGDREASYETLCKLADFFNTSVDYLLGRTTLNYPIAQWTEDEIAQGVGNHAIVLSDEDSYRLNLLAEAETVLGIEYVRALLTAVEIAIQQKQTK